MTERSQEVSKVDLPLKHKALQGRRSSKPLQHDWEPMLIPAAMLEDKEMKRDCIRKQRSQETNLH